MSEPNAAVHRCQQQVKKAQEQGDRKGELSAWYKLGTQYMSQGQYPQSIECHQNMLSIVKELSLSIQEGRAYYGIAKANSALNNVGEAIEQCLKCIAALEGEEHDRIVRMACCDLGNLYFMIRNINDSIEYSQKSLKHAEKALSIAKERNDLTFSEKTALLLGDAYMLSERPHEALKIHQQTLDYSLQNDHKAMQKTVYGKLAIEYKTIHDYRSAVEYFQRYQTIAKLTGDKKGEVDGYRHAGIANAEINNHEAALECFQNSLRIAIEIQDRQRVEYGYANVAIAYNKLSKYQQAIEYFEKSLDLYVEKGDRREESKCYLDLGKAYVALGRHEEAYSFLNKCIQLSKDMVDIDEKHAAYEYLGEAYYQLGNFKEAKQFYEKFLNISIQLKNKVNEHEAINKLGVIYKRLHYQDKAVECLVKTIRYAGGNDLKLLQANVSCNLGHLYTTLGRYKEAFDVLERGLHIAIEVGDAYLQSTAHLNIARVNHVLANRREKVNHAKRSVEIAKKSGNKKFEELADRALVTIANVTEESSIMVETAQKQVDLAEKSRNKYELTTAYLKLGRAYFLMGKYTAANSYLEKSVEVAREIGNNMYEGYTYEYLGYVNERLFPIDSSNKAFYFHEKHMKLSQETGDKSGCGKACRNLGSLFLLLYLRERSPECEAKAKFYLKESLRSYDAFLQDLGDEDEYKINVIETQILTHKLLVELYIEAGYLEKALLVSEQERGRSLEDILQRRYMSGNINNPTYDFLGYADIQSRVLSTNTCILFFAEMMRMRRSNFEQQVGTWVLDVENHVTFYCNELQGVKALLQHNNLHEDAPGEEDILNVLVDKVYFTVTNQRSDDCEDKSFTIRESAQEDFQRLRCVYDEELNEDYLALLYDTLITPVQDKLIHEEIVIVPNGPLFKVPFAALRNPHVQTDSFLVETKRVRIVPSLTTLKILKESSAESHSLTGALIVGNPDVGVKRILRGKERSFHSLPNAQLEAERIGEVLGVKALTSKQASKQVIIERLLQGVAVIHFAAHGCAETGEIILAPPEDLPTDKIPDEEDYLLTISEVQQTGLRARLVVLSCCHSGRGEIKSEGVIGMSRAFLAAGALAVVATLWAVDDKGTRVFMELFYSHLKQGKTASVSLQQAMKDMRNTTDYKKPMFWTPFVLIGDDMTIDIN